MNALVWMTVALGVPTREALQLDTVNAQVSYHGTAYTLNAMPLDGNYPSYSIQGPYCRPQGHLHVFNNNRGILGELNLCDSCTVHIH